MRGMHGIGDDALFGMKCVGARRWKRLVRIAVRDGLGLRGGDFERREIFNRSGPRELGIVKSGVVVDDGGKPGDRRYKKNDVPQGGSENSTLGNATLDPAIAEVVTAEKFSGRERTGNKRAEAAPEALAEIAPGDVELGLPDDGLGRRGRNGSHARGGRRALSQEVVPTIDLAQ